MREARRVPAFVFRTCFFFFHSGRSGEASSAKQAKTGVTPALVGAPSFRTTSYDVSNGQLLATILFIRVTNSPMLILAAVRRHPRGDAERQLRER